MMKVAKTGIIHKKFVSRKVSRLVARLKALAS
jgi:ribosomal protein S20